MLCLRVDFHCRVFLLAYGRKNYATVEINPSLQFAEILSLMHRYLFSQTTLIRKISRGLCLILFPACLTFLFSTS